MSSPPLSSVDGHATETENKRRSGRVTRRPDTIYTSSPLLTAKRKRDEVGDVEESASEEDDEEQSSEGEPDEEEIRERRAKARKSKSAAPKKPAAKRAKPNGNAVRLPIRAVSGKKRAPKKAKVLDAGAAEEAGGLYAEVFARGHTLEDVATEWLRQFDEHESRAVSELVNFVLKCAGCDLKVDEHDIEDPDGCTNKLRDLQEEYEQQNITEYPIVAKGKGTAAFKASITGFFYTLVKAIAASGTLFQNMELIENLEVWLSTMSSASNRPFRHTSTVISLSIITALCEVGRDLVESSAKALRHSENERKKARVNKARVSELQKQAKEAGQLQEKLDNLVKDWFDTIYIHRYRDVDPKIRVDCAQALGDWILTYPDVFFDGSHLRYLGWVLSDHYAPARHEVVRQLLRLYRDKDKLGGLKTFTERFRSRMVEMATKDHEIGVRAAAVELLDNLREGGLLEPDDIDAVGRLVFDAEPRVRKAVVPFFAESVNEAYEAKIEGLGGQEAIEEILPAEDSPGHDGPQLGWLKLKCLAEGLDSYDSVDADPPQHAERGPGTDTYHLNMDQFESRFAVAAETLYDQIDQVREWETLAGYLLHDTSADLQNGANSGAEAQLKEQLRLSEKEEVILLEVLSASVKETIARLVENNSAKKTKKTKKQREDEAEDSERAARHLTNLLPRLLKKFGESPQTATTVLRLERVVNLDAFQEFRQDSTTYAELLDNINKQFLTHGDEDVLAEASRALLRAKGYAELGDVTDERIEALWDDTIGTFDALTRGKDLNVRGTILPNVLDAIAKTVLRLEKLASIANPITYFETRVQSSTSQNQGAPPIESIMMLMYHAVPQSADAPEEDEDDKRLEDTIALHAARTTRFYFLWRTTLLRSTLESSSGTVTDADIDALAAYRDAYVTALTAVLEARDVRDDINTEIAGMLLDTDMLMMTLRQIKPRETNAQASQRAGELEAVAQELEPGTLRRILRVFGAAEAAFAKASGKVLETPAEEEEGGGKEEEDIAAEPADDEPLSDPENDDAAGDEIEVDEEGQETQASQVRRANKLQRSLVTEQRLCELAGKLVLGVLGGMTGAREVKERIERNKARLGPNFKEVLAHLEVKEKRSDAKRGKAAAARSKGTTATAAAAAAAVSGVAQTPKPQTRGPAKSGEVVVESDEEDEDDRHDEDEEMDEAEEQQEQEEREDEEAPEQGQADDHESVIGD